MTNNKKPKKTISADADLLIITEKGVKGKGYGIIAKAVMLDPVLELGDKTIYDYLCSYGGQGDGIYLRRSRILAELGISKDTFTKHMNALEKRGYITRTQSRQIDGTFGTKTIEIVLLPNHLANQILEAQKNENIPTIHSGTIYSLGYGFMPKMVARDTRLYYKARGVYGYLSVYTNTDGESWPSKEQIVKDLRISTNTLQKLMKQLLDYGYVSLTRLRDASGRMGQSIYTLNAFPQEAMLKRQKEIESRQQTQARNAANENDVTPQPKISDTVEDSKPSPQPNFSDTAKEAEATPQPKKPDTVLPDTNFSDTVYINNHYHIPTNTISLQDRLMDTVREKIEFNLLLFAYENDPMGTEALNLLMETIHDIFGTKNSRIQIGNQVLLTTHVIDTLRNISNQAVYNVIERYLARTDLVINPKAYLLKSIYQEILTPTPESLEETI